MRQGQDVQPSALDGPRDHSSPILPGGMFLPSDTIFALYGRKRQLLLADCLTMDKIWQERKRAT